MFVENKELEIVKQIINRIIPNHRVLAFGSRVSGKYLKKFSDLDLAVLGKQLTTETISQLAREFDNSNLPFKVDIVDYEHVNSEFKKIIDASHEVLQD